MYVDSPLAVSATEVFRMHPEDWDQEVRDFLLESAGRRPFDFSQLHYVQDASESKRLNYLTVPAIIISASGMCEHGRILHHLRNNITDPNDTILFVGFQAENTLGRKIVEGVNPVNIFGEPCPVRAQITVYRRLQRPCGSGRIAGLDEHVRAEPSAARFCCSRRATCGDRNGR